VDDVDCPEEATKQSKYSPSLVGNDEILLRAAYHPNHVDSDGRLTKTNMQITQIIAPNGFSVDRLSHFSQKAAAKTADNFNAKNSKNDFQGFFKARTGDIRALTHKLDNKEERSFCVIDDGLVDNPAHALITPSKKFRISATNKTEIRKASNRLRPLRAALIDLFNEMVKVEDIPEVIAAI